MTCSASAWSSARCSGDIEASSLRHRGHPRRHLLEQLVQRLRVAGEQVAVPLHEPVEVVRLAPLAALDHLVQLGDRVSEPARVPGATSFAAPPPWCGSTRPSPARAGAPSARRTPAAPRDRRSGSPRAPGSGPGRRAGSASRNASRIRASSSALKDSADRSRSTRSSRRSRSSSSGPARFSASCSRARRSRRRARSASSPLKLPRIPRRMQPGQRALRAGAREDVVREFLEQVARPDVGTERVLRVVPPRVPDPHGPSLRRPARNLAGRYRWRDGSDQSRPRPVVSARSDSPNAMNAASEKGIQGRATNGSSRASR